MNSKLKTVKSRGEEKKELDRRLRLHSFTFTLLSSLVYNGEKEEPYKKEAKE